MGNLAGTGAAGNSELGSRGWLAKLGTDMARSAAAIDLADAPCRGNALLRGDLRRPAHDMVDIFDLKKLGFCLV